MKLTLRRVGAVLIGLLALSLSAESATVPFTDDFESYTNQTPLSGGLNGWYATATNCIVQTNVSYTNYGGSKAAQIPIDVTLSNRLTGVAATSIWMRFYSRAVFFNGSTNGSDFAATNGARPVVDTNLSAMFYINTAGYFVVHNGPPDPDPTNSAKWVQILKNADGSDATKIVDGAWTRVEVLLDYPNTNWSLYANGAKLTNNLAFINSANASFSSFDTYNGGSTTFLDNVYITPSMTLTIDGLEVSNKYYDGTADATINTNALTLVGVQEGQTVNLDVDGLTDGVFENKSVGEHKTVTVTGLTISGADAGGYTLVTNVYGSIFARPLTLTGLAVSNKVYDGNTAAAIANTGVLATVVGAEVCYLNTNSVTASFASKTVAAGKTVTVGGLSLSGADATNYSVAVHTVTADITTNELAITTLLVSDKIYDGASNAAIATCVLATVVSGDSCYFVTNSAYANFENKNVGAGKAVYVTNITIAGSDAANYGITNQAAATAGASIWINSSALSLSGMTAANKVYDGNSNALITSYGTLNGVIGADVVTLESNLSAAVFSDRNTGNGKTVTVSGLTLGGADGANYSISNQTTTANITQAPLTCTADNKSKEWGTADPALTVSYASFVGGDNSNVVGGLVIARDPGENVGAYTITPSGSTSVNYSISFVNGTFTINKASRSVTFNPSSPQAYDTLQGLSATVTPGTGSWTFAVLSGPGSIVNNTNLWMGAGYGTVTVRAMVSGDATNAEGYADAFVVAQASPETNSIPWYDDFETYGTNAPLVGGINGWYATSTNCVVQRVVRNSGAQAVILTTDVMLSNRFDSSEYNRLVRMEFYSQIEPYKGTNYPVLTNNVAAQFFVNSNGFFVVGNGTRWQDVTNMADGAAAIPITNTYFTKVQVSLRYKNHTWNLKAWTNEDDLVASTHFINFASNLNTFGGFDIYNGATTSYLDDVSVTNLDLNVLPKINDVPVDIIRSINDAPPVIVDDIRIDGRRE